MSYILDALKRADAERERGAVPGLHAQPVPAGAGTGPARRASRLGMAALAAIALLSVGALTWRELAREAPPPATVGQAMELPLAQAPATPAESVVSVAAVPPPPPPAPVAPKALPPVPPGPETAKPSARERPAGAQAPASASARPAAAEPAASAAPPRVYALAELPDDVRGQLPHMSVNGSSYSSKHASRFLIINGRLFHEGDAIAPDLTVEEIKLKQAVLKFRQYRYSISY